MAEVENANCPSREELVGYNLGTVTEATLETISEHLQSCDYCLSALSAIKGVDDSLLKGIAKPPSEEPFLDEPECQRVLEKLEMLDFDPLAPEGFRSEPAIDIPDELGRYQILEELGRGGMGTVYLARDTHLDRQVALKIPRFRPNENPRFQQRFYREARASAAIKHPNLCPIYDVGEIDEIPYLSMAVIQGRSLAQLIKGKTRFSGHDAAEIVRKLALAIEEAHRHGVVHRDIKPSNVMITEEGEPILTDFGLARRIEVSDTRLTHSGLIVGTPSYMAPEQVDGDPETLGPCDVYSLGVVFYELLAGTVPFRGPLLSVLSQLGKDQPEPPSAHQADVDRHLERICLKAMAKEPIDRYQSAAEMADALERYLLGSPQAAGPPSWRRWLAWGSAAAAAALFLAAFVIYFKTGKGTLVLEISEPDVKVTIDGDQVQIKWLQPPPRATLYHAVCL